MALTPMWVSALQFARAVWHGHVLAAAARHWMAVLFGLFWFNPGNPPPRALAKNLIRSSPHSKVWRGGCSRRPGRDPPMAFAKPISPLQRTISQIEQALELIRPANDHDVRLRLCIEEAIEVGYEAVYSRAVHRKTAVLTFPSAGAPKDKPAGVAARSSVPQVVQNG
jgi:hypothetical protein